MVRQAPAGHDGAAAGHDAGDPVGRQRHVAQQHAGVDGHVVHALLALFDHGVPEDLPGQGVGLAVDLLQRLVDRDRADRDGGVADDPFARGVDVVPGGQVHDGVRAPLRGPLQLVDLLGDGAGHGGVADIGVDLHQERLADDHRLGFGVVDVVGNDRPARGHLAADQLHIAVLAQRHEPHFLGDHAVPGVVHLRDGLARRRRGAAPAARPSTRPRRRRGAPPTCRRRAGSVPGRCRLRCRPGLNPRRPERLQPADRIAARPGRAVDPERRVRRRRPGRVPGRSRSPARGCRAPGPCVKASEWDFSDCVVRLLAIVGGSG